MKSVQFRLINIFLIIAAGFIFLAGLPSVKVLSISNRKNSNERYYIKSQKLKGFEISYTHSVNKGRVHDFYSLPDNYEGLELSSTRFVSYGAGIPEPEETPGAVFTVTSEGYVISNLERRVTSLTMAVGLIANHEITFINKSSGSTRIFIMKDLFAPQTSIIFEKKSVSLISYIFHKLY